MATATANPNALPIKPATNLSTIMATSQCNVVRTAYRRRQSGVLIYIKTARVIWIFHRLMRHGVVGAVLGRSRRRITPPLVVRDESKQSIADIRLRVIRALMADENVLARFPKQTHPRPAQSAGRSA
jgi:acetylornithine/succinyldiaminopimelate/putrescine aminotransferase